MNIIHTRLLGAVILEPATYEDSRGYFMETYNEETLRKHGLTAAFIQDNHSLSKQAGTVRGMHYQLNPKAQTKLVRVTSGAVYDVIVDMRSGSPTFKQWQGFILSSENRRQLYVPKGFAHGFCTLSDNTEVQYKVDNVYSPEHDRGIIWNDPELMIDWPVAAAVLSEKDKNLPAFKDAEMNFEKEGVVV